MAFKGVGRAVSKGVPFTFAWARDAATTDATVAADDNRAMAFDYTHDVASTDHRDGNSTVYAVTFDEPVHQITIRTVPVGDSATNNATQARIHGIVPDIGTYVTLAGGPAYFNGTWIYKGGGSVSYQPDGVTEVSMTLFRHGFDVETPTTFATVQDL
jgi:hypothetical protein